MRRPPTDPVNALLSLGYTFLSSRVVARCEAAGLEVALGALHEYRPGRPSLACDLVEPLRVPLVDRWVLTMCNSGQVATDNFLADERQGVRLRPEIFPKVLVSWESHWTRSDGAGQMEAIVSDVVTSFRGTATPEAKGGQICK